MSALRIVRQREIIDRRAIDAALAKLHATEGSDSRSAVIALLRKALDAGRAEIARRLEARPSAGHEICAGHSFLIDQLVRLLHDHVVTRVYSPGNRSSAEQLAIMAVGGWGRQEMAPHSDVDIAFLVPRARTPWCEQVAEAMLYFLWDLGLTVGHSTRTPDDVVRMAREDHTVRTALLEGRFVWGERALYDMCTRRFFAEVVTGTEREFVAEKLAERDERHRRMGDSRYVVEPNVKDGKGALRDLHTLYWIGKYIHKVRVAADLVEADLFTRAEYRGFRRAEGFLLAVRCHMHELTGREEDRLTFDLQRAVAERMRFAERPGKSAVERFMQFYFLQAKRVGSLTGVFLAHIDEQFARRGWLAGLLERPRTVQGYTVTGSTIAAPSDDWFREDPVRLIEIFRIAEAEGFTVHPDTMRQADRDSGLIKAPIRNDARANALFLDLLAGRNDPETVLRWMNEANVFGKFVPDFGKVNAQMQFDMYHHYTVDEHTIRAIGLLAKIERGALADDHPRATRQMPRIASRRALYVAVLLHDIAKGRGGDHSVLGGEVAMRLCPRFGLDAHETELVAWLVRQHLLMSATAQKRDLADPKTIDDFVAEVQSVERLRNLAILTAVDIRAVGPGTWNSWKAQLLGTLYDAAEERLRLGHTRINRREQIAAKKAAVTDVLGTRGDLVADHGGAFAPAYWIAETDDVIAHNLVQYADGQERGAALTIRCKVDETRGATLVTVVAADHAGLFYRIAGGIHLAGANIIDARIHTTRTGWAVDNFLVQTPLGEPFAEDAQIARIETAIEDALANRIDLAPKLARRPLPRSRSKAFDVQPRVVFDNAASNRFTVIEINARDRSALLNRVARSLFESGVVVHSAHLTTYGERAADTFYVTDTLGDKITGEAKRAAIETALLAAVSDRRQAELERA